MKLAIVGYGRMGRLIEQLAPQYGFEPALILDVHNNADGAGLTEENFRGIRAAIEFTGPESAADNLLRLAALGVPSVCGATGWYARLGEVKEAFEKTGTGFIYGPNFSIGVNIFERIVAEAARLFSNQPDYEAWAWEIHHSAKKDAPSGTLLKLVDAMRRSGYQARIDTASNRAGSVPGTHEIGFDSAADTVTLRHTARSREGFARGALWAAQRLAEGLRGCHEFSEVLFGAAR
ncbi:MAG: dihydrodipicolinate reductase [Bryobacteraceae bacterium]|nr:dihydrodipicolinate reductase [Bryobacteraceae bacterium]MCX7603057.1 dihydrodipicolinate reductase [Bryobacteraceae bacterium]